MFAISRLLLVFLLLSVCVFADEFGYTTQGATPGTIANPVCTKFTASADGTVTAMSAPLDWAGGTATVRFAAYSDSSGSPDAKLAESDETSFSSDGVKSANISFSIVNATVYWLCMWDNNTSNGGYYDAGTTAQMAYKEGETYPTWPDPFNETATFDRQYSIYATYTPSGGGGGGSGFAPSAPSLLGVGAQ